MRVLHCIASLGGGGAERQLAYLSAELTRKGTDVHIAYHQGGPNLRNLEDCGVQLHALPSRGNYDPLLFWRLVKLIWRIKPNLIQTWLLQMDVLAGLAAVLTRTPLLVTERSSELNYKRSWKTRLRSWVGRRAALIVANSNSGKEYWLSEKRPQSIKVIRNGVPVEQIRQTSPAYWEEQGSIRETSEIVLFAGRYSAEKNLSTLLDAIFLVCSERANAIALFFGEGPLQRELIAKVRRHKMEERVRILDYTTQLWGWMKRADLFVSVSSFEGSPNTVLEAAAQGCPLVLSDIPQHRELLDDDAAFFVSPQAPSDIAQGILEVLRDPAKAKRRAQSAYQTVFPLTLDSIAREYLNVYRLALKG